MWKSDFTARWRSGLLTALALVLTAPFAAAFAQASHAQPSAPKRVVVFEWLPLGAHSAILNAFEETLADAEGEATPKVELSRITVIGDDKELSAALKRTSAHPPDLVLGFGDHVCSEVRKAIRNAPFIALLVKSPDSLPRKTDEEEAPLACISAAPDAKRVLLLARELDPDMGTLGVIFTDEYAPNVALATELKCAGKPLGVEVMKTLVPHGACRTDSDFEKALAPILDPGKCDILYVPDDPNCSRFGHVIYRIADKHGVPAIGSEATIGKGCVVALALDYEAIGQQAAAAALGMWRKGRRPAARIHMPAKVVVDHEAADRHNASLSRLPSEPAHDSD